MRKVYETPHEKRQRRLAKKMEKERKKKSALGWDAEHMVNIVRNAIYRYILWTDDDSSCSLSL